MFRLTLGYKVGYNPVIAAQADAGAPVSDLEAAVHCLRPAPHWSCRVDLRRRRPAGYVRGYVAA